jgi:uncharacterized protein YjbI with pentapeptide repeats
MKQRSLFSSLSGLFLLVPLTAFAQTGVATDRCTLPAAPGVDWHGCDLSHSDLSGVNLADANLRGVKFSASNLRGANLSNSDLREAAMIGADLQEVDFSGADLRGSFMTKAQLGKNNFAGTVFDGAYYNNFHVCAEGSVGVCK